MYPGASTWPSATIWPGLPLDGRDLTIHTGPASYTRIIPGVVTRRTIHPGRTL